MSQSACRWGIVGTANIARKNWKAMRMAGNAVLVAVASRDAARAQKFIDECQVEAFFSPAPAACGSYDALLKRADIDAVYLPLPTGIRPEWAIKAAEHGKHVLCEKPCGTTADDVRAILDACRTNRVQFMDGVMFMHGKRLPLLRRVLDDGESVGEIRRIVSQFTFKAPEEFLRQNIRVSHRLEPLGCLGDLGWYNVRLSLWAMGYALPKSATGRILAEHGSGSDAVPLEFSGELLFAGGATASFYCSFQTELQQWANVSGSRGHLHFPDFVLPFYGCENGFEVNRPNFRVEGCRYHMESHPRRYAVNEYSDGAADSQESNMIRCFSEGVLGGRVDPSWGEIALQTQVVLDACLRSARDGGRAVSIEA